MFEKLRLLRFRNARGSHIYLRPSGEHRYTVLDDLEQGKLARLSAEAFEPCAVVETSPGNFQAWLKHTVVLPRLLGTFVAQTLAARFGADPSATEWALSPRRGPRFLPSLERFRTSSKYVNRPAAADIAFCVAAYTSSMDEALIEQALTDD